MLSRVPGDAKKQEPGLDRPGSEDLATPSCDVYYSTLVGPVGRGTFITRNLSVSLLSLYQQ